MTSRYEINKGINRSIEFKGVRAQYITYLAAGLVLLLLLFAIGFIVGISVYLLVVIIGVGGFGLITYVYKLSHKYGEHGLMKEAAYRRTTTGIICRSREIFIQLNSIENKL